MSRNWKWQQTHCKQCLSCFIASTTSTSLVLPYHKAKKNCFPFSRCGTLTRTRNQFRTSRSGGFDETALSRDMTRKPWCDGGLIHCTDKWGNGAVYIDCSSTRHEISNHHRWPKKTELWDASGQKIGGQRRSGRKTPKGVRSKSDIYILMVSIVTVVNPPRIKKKNINDKIPETIDPAIPSWFMTRISGCRTNRLMFNLRQFNNTTCFSKSWNSY